MTYIEVQEQVIKLHDTARLIEQDFGSCDLSQTLRQAADNLSEFSKRRIIELYADSIL